MSPDGSTKPSPPEERLLRLLRGKGRAAPPVPAAPTGPAEPAVVATPGHGSGRPAWSWLRAVVIGLAVVLVLEVGVMIAELVRPEPEIHVPVARPTRPSQTGDTEPVPIPSLAEAVSRPLFTATVARPTVARTVPSGGAQQLTTRLALLGIVPGDPSQAIIEDAQTERTYFVAVGQQVVEGAILDAVHDAHVVLDLQGEKIELRL